MSLITPLPKGFPMTRDDMLYIIKRDSGITDEILRDLFIVVVEELISVKTFVGEIGTIQNGQFIVTENTFISSSKIDLTFALMDIFPHKQHELWLNDFIGFPPESLKDSRVKYLNIYLSHIIYENLKCFESPEIFNCRSISAFGQINTSRFIDAISRFNTSIIILIPFPPKQFLIDYVIKKYDIIVLSYIPPGTTIDIDSLHKIYLRVSGKNGHFRNFSTDEIFTMDEILNSVVIPTAKSAMKVV